MKHHKHVIYFPNSINVFSNKSRNMNCVFSILHYIWCTIQLQNLTTKIFSKATLRFKLFRHLIRPYLSRLILTQEKGYGQRNTEWQVSDFYLSQLTYSRIGLWGLPCIPWEGNLIEDESEGTFQKVVKNAFGLFIAVLLVCKEQNIFSILFSNTCFGVMVFLNVVESQHLHPNDINWFFPQLYIFLSTLAS